MTLSTIDVHDFRSFHDMHIDVSPRCTLIVGKNAAGKTNMLEAVYALQYGSSFRAHSADMIKSGTMSASITAKLDEAEAKILLMEKGRAFFINGVRKSLQQYIERMMGAVLFQPEDVAIITGVPQLRREFVNRVFAVDLAYIHALQQYERGLYKRNKLLENTMSSAFLHVLGEYNNFLLPHASALSKGREKFCDFCNTHSQFAGREFRIVYKKNPFNEETILWNRERELAAHKTLFGPQRDDFIVEIKNKEWHPLSSFGARSEQRMAVLWLKREEMHFLEEYYDKQPLCLLDDVFSELDHTNSRYVLEMTKGRQTIITTAHTDVLEVIKDEVETIIDL